MGQGGGREGELFYEMKENLNFGQKLPIFYVTKKSKKKN